MVEDVQLIKSVAVRVRKVISFFMLEMFKNRLYISVGAGFVNEEGRCAFD